jgi:putative radical SAM enzyme (TIGR03279 family)
MSFLAGNYITLTNLTDADVERIVKMHISPINVSVHTTNPELRVKLMANKNAGKCLSYMDTFAENGIWMNVQIVLCPELNDGAELERSLTELEKYIPALQSIAVVPVGLTKHREGLYPLRSFTKDEARAVIATVDRYGDAFLKKHGERICYCADELYIKAELPIPEEDYYGDYPQFDNGVGLIRSFKTDVSICMEDEKLKKKPKPFSVVTGYAAYPTLNEALDRICTEYFEGDRSFVKLYKIKNEFFGDSVTVAGLVTGGDIIRELEGKQLGERLYIPKVMLRYEMDRFLDDVTVDELSEKLNVEVVPTDTDGAAFFELFK